MLFGYLFLDNILYLFGATEETVAYARQYMLVVLPGMFFLTMAFNLTSLIRASGYPIRAMLILGGGAVLNIILDPIFIFGFNWGIAGAAWATTISMATMTLFAILHFAQKNSFIRFKRHAWKPKGYIFRNILMIGMSPFLMNITAAGVVAILNRQLIIYGGDMAVGANGIVNSFMNFLILFMLGVCQGMQPIAGYNYGAGHPQRLRQVYLLTMKVCVLSGVVGCLLGCFCPEWIAKAFTSDEMLISISVVALPFLSMMSPLIGFTICNSNFFQSIDKPWIAIVTSLSRQVIFLVPLCYFLPRLWELWGKNGLDGVWLSATFSDVLGAALAAVLLFMQRKVFTQAAVLEPRPLKEVGPTSDEE